MDIEDPEIIVNVTLTMPLSEARRVFVRAGDTQSVHLAHIQAAINDAVRASGHDRSRITCAQRGCEYCYNLLLRAYGPDSALFETFLRPVAQTSHDPEF